MRRCTAEGCCATSFRTGVPQVSLLTGGMKAAVWAHHKAAAARRWSLWVARQGQVQPVAPNTDFVAVAGGFFHSHGLKAGGSIVGWGE